LFTNKDVFKLSKVEKQLQRRMKQMELVDGQLVAKKRTLATLDESRTSKKGYSKSQSVVTEDGEVWSTKKPRFTKTQTDQKKPSGKPERPARPGKPVRPAKPGKPRKPGSPNSKSSARSTAPRARKKR
jgi:hypothetical protein